MLLPAGRPDPDPIGGLTSARMRSILDEAAARFDWVILDAPPMGPMADANLLASMVDGAVFVVRSGRTHHQAAQRAIEALGRERILGVVLNGVEKMPSEQYELLQPSDQRGRSSSPDHEAGCFPELQPANRAAHRSRVRT